MSLGIGGGSPASEIVGELVHTFNEADDAEPITPLDQSTSSIAVQALNSNQSPVYLGGSNDLDDQNGFSMPPGAVLTFDLDVREAPIYGYAVSQGDELRMMATD